MSTPQKPLGRSVGPNVGPSASVDVFSPPEAKESAAWRSVSLIPFAAFVFALIAWGATGALAWQSETLGIQGATVAMFPTGFGAAGLIARQQELARERPSVRKVLLVACGGGFVSMILFGVFMAGVWPSL